MRFTLLAAVTLGLAACAAPQPVRPTTTSALTPSDAATGIVTGPLTMSIIEPAAGETEEGMDPIITLELKHADGRTMQFQEANHTPYDNRAQAAGGPLADVMGLFGEEQPVLYAAVPGANVGAPFICGAEGPLMLGVYRDAAGAVTMVGLKSGFDFEEQADGTATPIPYSPDHVCARLRFSAAPAPAS